MKACSLCGAPALPGKTRCANHYVPPHHNSAAYKRNAAIVRATATRCHLCDQPRWPNDINPTTGKHDPLVADHVIPHSLGGTSDLTNLRAAHKSCNSRRGANRTNGA